MKIVHVCFTITDGMAYQDNLLPKFQRKLGAEVIVLTSRWVYDQNGKMYMTEQSRYVNDDDVRIVRLNIKHNKPYTYRFRKLDHLAEELRKSSPDILFLHGFQWVDIDTVVKFVKQNPQVRVYVDNHADYSNSATNWISKFFLHGMIWRHYAKRIEPYAKYFFGTLPARVDILSELYGIERDKCRLLLMGADDDLVDMAQRESNLQRRRKLCEEGDFLIVTGGKLDKAKTQVLLLMQAVQELNEIMERKCRLLVFGSVAESIKQAFFEYVHDKVEYLGWLNTQQIYELIVLADLAVYPGRHSVIWEQTVALGIPMVVKYWDRTTHVDIGGNVRFLSEDSKEEMKKELRSVLQDPKLYAAMKTAANSEKRQKFLYSKIAQDSISD